MGDTSEPTGGVTGGVPDDLYGLAESAGIVPKRGGYMEPVTSPAQADSETYNAGGSEPTSNPMYPYGSSGMKTESDVGVSSSTKGYSEAKQKQVDKQDASLNADYQKAAGQAQGMAAPEVAAVNSAHGSGIDAAKVQADALVNQKLAEGHNASFMADLQNSFGNEEMKINAHYTAMSNQAKTDYVAALSDFRASRVNPSQLFDDMSSGQRFGTMVSAFVHDFLGARGIHTSAMDTLNKAVDRNIESQIQAIKTKGEVAEGFKSLWYMQRNQASSDAEARARVKGFLLDGAKQQIVSNMSQYEAGLATAQGKAAIAKVDEELAKNMVDVYRHVDQNTIALRQQALSWHAEKLKAANESYANSLKAKELDMQMSAKQDKAKSDLLSSLVPDNSVSGGGHARWMFYAGDKGTQDKVRDRLGALSAFDDKFRQYQELSKQVGPLPFDVDNEAMNKGLSQDQRRLKVLRDEMAMNLAYAQSGKTMREDESNYQRRRLQVSTMLQRGGTDEIAANTARNLHMDAFSELGMYARELNPGEVGYGLKLGMPLEAGGKIPSGTPGRAETVEGDTIANSPNHGEPPATPTGTAIQELAKPSATQPADSDVLKSLGVTKDETNSEWELFQSRNKELGTYQQETGEGGDVGGPGRTERKNYEATNWVGSFVALRKEAEKGDNTALKTLAKEAFTELYEGGNEEAQRRQAFARMELAEFKHPDVAPKDVKPTKTYAEPPLRGVMPDYPTPTDTEPNISYGSAQFLRGHDAPPIRR